MGIIMLNIGKPAPLLPGEVLVRAQRSFRAVTSKTFPSYRIGFNLGPLSRISLIVTNRRCRILGDFFGVMHQDIALWYPGKNPPGDPELITGVCTTRGLFGPCLELRSNDPRRRSGWLWSPDLTLRFFMARPAALEAAILSQMAGDRG